LSTRQMVSWTRDTSKDEAIGSETALLRRFENLLDGTDKSLIGRTNKEHKRHNQHSRIKNFPTLKRLNKRLPSALSTTVVNLFLLVIPLRHNLLVNGIPRLQPLCPIRTG
jgi:hypothetical protein